MRKRNCRVEVYFSKAELEELNRLIRKTHFSREAYIRKVLTGVVPKEAPPAEYYDLIRELRRVGSHLNRLSKSAGVQEGVEAERLKEALDQNRAAEKLLWETFSPHEF